MYKLHFYSDRRGDAPVRNFIREFNKKSRVKIGKYLTFLEKDGPDLPRPYADHVRDKIRELRVPLPDGNVRIFYFFFIERNIILLHGFKKKTQELPEREINQAERNMNDIIERHHNGEIQF